jgi:hypothetical protein
MTLTVTFKRPWWGPTRPMRVASVQTGGSVARVPLSRVSGTLYKGERVPVPDYLRGQLPKDAVIHDDDTKAEPKVERIEQSLRDFDDARAASDAEQAVVNEANGVVDPVDAAIAEAQTVVEDVVNEAAQVLGAEAVMEILNQYGVSNAAEIKGTLSPEQIDFLVDSLRAAISGDGVQDAAPAPVEEASVEEAPAKRKGK